MAGDPAHPGLQGGGGTAARQGCRFRVPTPMHGADAWRPVQYPQRHQAPTAACPGTKLYTTPAAFRAGRRASVGWGFAGSGGGAQGTLGGDAA